MVAPLVFPLAVSISALFLFLTSWVQQLTPLAMLHDALYPPPFTLNSDSPASSTLFLHVSHNSTHPLPSPSHPPLPYWGLPIASIPCYDNISCSLGHLSTYSPSALNCSGHPPPLPPPPPSTPVAILVEARDDYWNKDTLAFLLNDAINHLPSHWLIHTLLVPQLIPWLMSKPLLAAAVCQRRLVMHAMPDTLQFSNRGLYNALLSHHQFWRLWHGRTHVHLFELDTGYCAHPTRGWEFYLQFDYCGARWGNWEDTCWPATGNYTKNCVGNSGFSMWRQPVMEYLTANISMPLAGNLIDSFWTLQMRKFWPNYNPCPYDEADRFSTETFFVHNHPTDIPLGWHKPYLHARTPEQLLRFKTVCPHWINLTEHHNIQNLLPKGAEP